MAKGLLDQHARKAGLRVAHRGQPAVGQTAEDGGVVLRRHGQIEQRVNTPAPLVGNLGDVHAECPVRVRVIERPAPVAESLEERVERFSAGVALRQDVAHSATEVRVGPIAPGESDHP